MELNEFKTLLKSGTPSGVYIFAGEEDYLKRYYLAKLRERCAGDESLAVFNHTVYDGNDIDFAAILEDMKSPPMMNDFKLIEWRHADFTALEEKEFSLLMQIFEEAKEYPQAVVAFFLTADGFEYQYKSGQAAKAQKGKKYYCGKIQNQKGFLYFEKSTVAQLYSWLRRHFEALGVTVGNDALAALIFRAGRNMDVLEKEVAKISYMALSRGKTAVDARDVEEAASTTPECDTFDLSNALSERNKELAYKAIAKMKHDRQDPIVVTAMIMKSYIELLTVARYVNDGIGASDMEKEMKLNPRRTPHLISAAKRYGLDKLSEIVQELSRIDVASKYGGIGGYTAIEIFISTYL